MSTSFDPTQALRSRSREVELGRLRLRSRDRREPAHKKPRAAVVGARGEDPVRAPSAP
jgi:hypothetical protein